MVENWLAINWKFFRHGELFLLKTITHKVGFGYEDLEGDFFFARNERGKLYIMRDNVFLNCI